jgi:hypothetical protein
VLIGKKIMLYDKNDAQLLLISCQKAALAKSIDANECSSQILKLAAIAKIFNIPAWSVLAYKTQWGEQIDDLTPFFPEPIESVTFSAANVLLPFLNPSPKSAGGNARSLPKHLQKSNEPPEPKRPVIVMAGGMVHVGVMQSALELLELGYEPMVVVDACTAQHTRDKDAAFDRLASAGVELTTVEMLSMEWLKSSDAPESASVLKQLYKE